MRYVNDPQRSPPAPEAHLRRQVGRRVEVLGEDAVPIRRDEVRVARVGLCRAEVGEPPQQTV